MKVKLKQLLKKFKNLLKIIMNIVLPAYRVSRRVDALVQRDIPAIKAKQEYFFWLQMAQEGELISETKRRVFANLPPAEGVLREAQMTIATLLEEFDVICRRENLTYWLMGGTLIGAIRHKGFIPWDGDADVGMMRKDYEKLKWVLNEENGQIEAVDFYNFNGNYRIPKIIVKNTDAQIMIDIIVFDYVQSDDPLLDIWSQQQIMRKKYISALENFRTKVPEIKNTEIIKDVERRKELTDLTNAYVDMCNYESDDGNVIIWGIDNFTSHAVDPRRIYTKKSIYPLKELEFEGHIYYVANDYMDMITREAGNIWSFPNDIGTPKQFSLDRFECEMNKVREAQQRRREQMLS